MITRRHSLTHRHPRCQPSSAPRNLTRPPPPPAPPWTLRSRQKSSHTAHHPSLPEPSRVRLALPLNSMGIHHHQASRHDWPSRLLQELNHMNVGKLVLSETKPLSDAGPNILMVRGALFSCSVSRNIVVVAVSVVTVFVTLSLALVLA